MEVVCTITDVRSFDTRGGNTRFVARDSDGNEYTTFREAIGERAKELKGSRVRTTYHESQRGQYTNVYLMRWSRSRRLGSGGDTDAEEAAWRTAVEAAPWLVGKPGDEVAPDELYDRLKPFEERVAADIEASQRAAAQDD